MIFKIGTHKLFRNLRTPAVSEQSTKTLPVGAHLFRETLQIILWKLAFEFVHNVLDMWK